MCLLRMGDGFIHIHCPVRDKPHSAKHRQTDLIRAFRNTPHVRQAVGQGMLSAVKYEGKFKAKKWKVAKFIIVSSMAHILVINETLLFICVLGMDYEPL